MNPLKQVTNGLFGWPLIIGFIAVTVFLPAKFALGAAALLVIFGSLVVVGLNKSIIREGSNTD